MDSSNHVSPFKMITLYKNRQQTRRLDFFVKHLNSDEGRGFVNDIVVQCR